MNSRRASSSRTVKRGKASPRRTRARAKPGAVAGLLARQPLSPAIIRRIAVALFTVTIIAVALVAAHYSGVTAYAREQLVQAIGRAGYSVQRIEVVGARRIDRLKVYDIALEQKDRSMAAFDIEEVRRELMANGWVADARVSRRLPDTLRIDLVERAPVAVWQQRGRYVLMDGQGDLLPDVDAASVPGLPVLVGDAPHQQMPAFVALMEAAPALRPQVIGATWVGHRRWDVRFRSGETLALPEGEARAHDALAEFARMDGVNRLLGRGIVRFDMRFDGRLIFRPGRDGDLGDLGLISGSDRAVEPAGGSPATGSPANGTTGGA